MAEAVQYSFFWILFAEEASSRLFRSFGLLRRFFTPDYTHCMFLDSNILYVLQTYRSHTVAVSVHRTDFNRGEANVKASCRTS